jgi:hypothetical protein
MVGQEGINLFVDYLLPADHIDFRISDELHRLLLRSKEQTHRIVFYGFYSDRQ